MSDLTQQLTAYFKGERRAAAELLPLVYDELRRLAAQKLAQEPTGQTLQATALVHEAYVRLVGESDEPDWENRGHFFAAAAEAMRRILVENARRKNRLRHGGDLARVEMDNELAIEGVDAQPREDLLALDAALSKLLQVDATGAKLVQLRYFTGLTLGEAGEMLGLSSRTADRTWAFAKAWLHREIESTS